jgi:type IV pilus assembly protein PilQ
MLPSKVSRKKANLGFFACWLCFAILFVQFGCRGQDHIQRKSVQDLYGEAIHAASCRPDIIQPCFPSHHRDYEHTVPVEEIELLPSSVEISARPPVLSRSSIQERVHSEDSSFGVASTRRSKNPIKNSEHVPKIVTASYLARNDNSKVSEIFEQTDIREAIQILATAANVSVVIDDTVGGVTSAQIENESFETALDKILMPLGLVYVKLEGKYLIAPPDPDSPLYSYVSERDQFAPQYHDVMRLTGLLPPRYKKFVHTSAERNLILIDAPREIGSDIRKRLEELDEPVPQVELEAIVCVVSPDSGFRFGLDWGHVVGIQGVDSLKAGMTGLTFSGSASPNGVDNAFSDFAVTSAFVRLLAQEGYITIRAAPRVTAKDGEKASISINREAFFSLQPSGSNVLFRQDVQKVESGITLEIIPRVHGDMVSVNIGKAEVSEDIRASDSRAELTSNPFPIINRRVVSTNVNVQDGHTIVIGGLVQSQTVDRVNRIPGLSRLPLVGGMFKTIDKQKQDAEVAIFISPRIVPTQRNCIPK